MTVALIMAHAGHWFAGLLYLAPVLIVVGALWRQSVKDKRRGDDEDDEDEDDDDLSDLGVDHEPGAG